VKAGIYQYVPVSKHHAMKIYKGAHILNLKTRWWVDSFTLPSLYIGGKEPLVHRECGIKSEAWYSTKDKSLACP